MPLIILSLHLHYVLCCADTTINFDKIGVICFLSSLSICSKHLLIRYTLKGFPKIGKHTITKKDYNTHCIFSLKYNDNSFIALVIFKMLHILQIFQFLWLVVFIIEKYLPTYIYVES